MSEVNKENMKDWVEALRSGGYKQAKDTLRDGDTFCCLGVVCDIADIKDYEWSGETTFGKGEDKSSTAMPKAVQKWLGTRTSNPYLVTANGDEIRASELNDEHDYNFNEIADCIERTFINV